MDLTDDEEESWSRRYRINELGSVLWISKNIQDGKGRDLKVILSEELECNRHLHINTGKLPNRYN